MDMDVGVAVGVCDFLIIDFGKPIVRGDGAGIGENEAADGIGDGGILFDAPVSDAEIAVDDVFEVDVGVLDGTDLSAFVAIIHIGFGDIDVSGLDQNDFDGVLDVLDGDGLVFDFVIENAGDAQGKQLKDFRSGVFVLGRESAFDGAGDFL